MCDFALFLSVMKNPRAYRCVLSILMEEPDIEFIFITQEDIFQRDQAKYTFSERCKEIYDLELEDGTTKIFFNMTSKNGSQELISLLQYMKETRIDNPNILVKDSRILELDDIVQEVKASEEWEAVKMNILEIGIEKGKEIGIERGLAEGRQQGLQQKLTQLVEKILNKGLSVAEIAELLEESEETIQMIVEELLIKQGENNL